MSLRDLQRSVNQSAAQQDAAVLAFQAELRRVLSRLTRALKLELADWDVDDTSRLRRSFRNIARVIALRRQTRALLDEAGFDALVVDALADPLDALAVTMLRGSGVDTKLGPNVRQTMRAWKDLRLADLLDIADDVARSMQRVALDGVLGLRPVDRLIGDVRTLLDVTERQARTLYDTAIAIFSRQVEQLQSTGDPEELFVYIGPDDEKTRPFCEKWIGKVRTREFWERLDNGQLPNPFLTGGGYQCRHMAKRVSPLDQELIDIAGTDQRAGVAA